MPQAFPEAECRVTRPEDVVQGGGRISCTLKLIIRGFYVPDGEQTMAREIPATGQGVPVTDARRSLTPGERMPAPLQDVHLIEIQEMMV